ncbi:MAG: hypothetical protein RSE07_01520, partial [Oscillospiraceae bacterium]
LMIGSLRASQVLALILFIIGIILIVIIRLKIKGNHDENYLKLYALTDEWQQEKLLMEQEENKGKNKLKEDKEDLE